MKIYQKAFETVKQHFPGFKFISHPLHALTLFLDCYFLLAALSGRDTLAKCKKVLLDIGVTAENTLFAQSVCPDEINHGPHDITNLFSSYMGEVFHLGGLGGIPFTGITGFNAFSHHIPDGY